MDTKKILSLVGLFWTILAVLNFYKENTTLACICLALAASIYAIAQKK